MRTAILWALLPLAAAQAQPWVLENPSMRVTVERSGAFTLRHKATGQDWRADAASRSGTLGRATVSAGGRRLQSPAEWGGARVEVVFELAPNAPELRIKLAAGARDEMPPALEFPLALKPPDESFRIVLPHKSGLMFTVADALALPKVRGRYECYAGAGLSMPWFGLTNLRSSLMTVFETPADSGLDVRIAGAGKRQSFAPQIYWLPVRGAFGYPRSVTYRLVAGGYVEMAKSYRKRLLERGEFTTLREKAAAHPQAAKLVGAIDLHLRGAEEDQRAVVETLESHGVRRMLLNTGASASTVAWLKERGYLAGAYKIYTDIHPARPGLPEELGRGYPQHAYTQKDGTPVRGFAFSETRRSTYRCPLLQLPLMIDLVPPLLAERSYDALFLDVVTAGNSRECYAAAHPLDRRADIEWRTNILRYAAGLGIVIGSEDGNAWAAPHLDYFEGMAMPRRFGYIPGVTVGNWPKPFELNDEYVKVDLNERVRVPLWDLVFHDSVVSTWRWNFTPDRYPDPKWWDKHDLLLMVAGNMPIFLLSRDHFEKAGQRIVASYRTCSEWNAKTGWDELVDHRALTADRSVQESRFSSGWAVTVNFAQGRAYGVGAAAVRPGAYRVYRWKGGGK